MEPVEEGGLGKYGTQIGEKINLRILSLKEKIKKIVMVDKM